MLHHVLRALSKSSTELHAPPSREKSMSLEGALWGEVRGSHAADRSGRGGHAADRSGHGGALEGAPDAALGAFRSFAACAMRLAQLQVPPRPPQ